MRKLLLLICIALLLTASAAAELAVAPSPTPVVTPEAYVVNEPEDAEHEAGFVMLTPTPAALPRPTAIPDPVKIETEDGSFPQLNADGFLDNGEFVYINGKDGIWRYCSSVLKVEILRHQNRSPKMVWYEAEVFARDGEAFHMYPYKPDHPMTASTFPHKVAKLNNLVFGVNTDYAHSRINTGKKRAGIIVRNNVIYFNKTLAADSKQMPNMDVLALYPNGNMEVYLSDAHTAEEYLEMGVESTLAFGPILVENGQIDQRLYTLYGKAKNPRTAIGMVEPGHYWTIMV